MSKREFGSDVPPFPRKMKVKPVSRHEPLDLDEPDPEHADALEQGELEQVFADAAADAGTCGAELGP